MSSSRFRTDHLNSFITRRRPHWERLEYLLRQVEASGLKSLQPREVREFGGLYRRASSDLVSARSRTGHGELIDYLNDLVARAYAQVYGARSYKLATVIQFLRSGFPALARRYGVYCLLAALFLMGGCLFGWQLYLVDADGAFRLLPSNVLKQLPELREHWRGSTGHAMPAALMPALSSFLMTHNIGIGLLAFAGGITFGILPAWALFTNGVMLGVLGSAMSRGETGLVFWSLILPHGIIELSAIAVMGAAGFVLASALISPGEMSRRRALQQRGGDALQLALGGAAMLVIAGLIEGFVTPPAIIPPVAKLGFAALTALAMLFYFGLGGRSGRPA